MKNIKISVLAATVLLASCGQKKEELVSGITKMNMDTLVKPGDNFDRFVNGTWSKNNKIPADKSVGNHYLRKESASICMYL